MTEHETLRRDLPVFVSGLLSAEREILVRRHIDGCRECEREHAAWARIGSAIGSAGAAAPDAKRLASIATLARARRSQILEERRTQALLTWLAAIVAAGGAAIVPALPRWLGVLSGTLALPPASILLVGLGAWWVLSGSVVFGLVPLLRVRAPAEARKEGRA